MMVLMYTIYNNTERIEVNVMITKEMLIGDILQAKEEAAMILMSNGMGCVGCPSSQMESLEQAAMVHGMDVNNLLADLNK